MAKKAARVSSDVLGGVLHIHSDEDRVAPEKRDGIKHGITTGLNLTHFTNEMFYNNYEMNLGDDELHDLLEGEFPNRIPSGGVIQKISAYRGYFNQGVHGHGLFVTSEEGTRALAPDEKLGRFLSQAEQEVRDAKKQATDDRAAAKKAEKAAIAAKAKAEKEKAEAKATPKAGTNGAAPKTASGKATPAPAKGVAPKAAPKPPTPAARPTPPVPRRPAAAGKK